MPPSSAANPLATGTRLVKIINEDQLRESQGLDFASSIPTISNFQHSQNNHGRKYKAGQYQSPSTF